MLDTVLYERYYGEYFPEGPVANSTLTLPLEDHILVNRRINSVEEQEFRVKYITEQLETYLVSKVQDILEGKFDDDPMLKNTEFTGAYAMAILPVEKSHMLEKALEEMVERTVPKEIWKEINFSQKLDKVEIKFYE